MAVDIVIPDSAHSSPSVPLNGTVLNLDIHYNSRDKNWRVGVSYTGTPVLLPETVKADSQLFENQDEAILGGTVHCISLTGGTEITRDNFLTDFVLRFYTIAELDL